jgi:glycosyltransferase involved in cell wall biosynthesis
LLLIAKSLPEYEFHLAGKFQEDDVCEYMQELPKNVFLNSWQYDLSEFYKDKTYIINTSLRESQAMSVLEGMACGLKPIINNWTGAKDIYDAKFIYENIQDVVSVLHGDYEPKKYRQFVEENYNSDKIYPQIEKLFEKVIV